MVYSFKRILNEFCALILILKNLNCHFNADVVAMKIIKNIQQNRIRNSTFSNSDIRSTYNPAKKVVFFALKFLS
jgi:hypothetical protein